MHIGLEWTLPTLERWCLSGDTRAVTTTLRLPVAAAVMEGGEATSAKEASAEEWAEGEEEECMAMVAVVASMATTTMDLTMEEVVLGDEVVMMIGARGLERIWMDLPAG